MTVYLVPSNPGLVQYTNHSVLTRRTRYLYIFKWVLCWALHPAPFLPGFHLTTMWCCAGLYTLLHSSQVFHLTTMWCCSGIYTLLHSSQVFTWPPCGAVLGSTPCSIPPRFFTWPPCGAVLGSTPCSILPRFFTWPLCDAILAGGVHNDLSPTLHSNELWTGVLQHMHACSTQVLSLLLYVFCCYFFVGTRHCVHQEEN